MEPVMVYMTAKDALQARSIARELVSARLAACVNIMDGMTSVFWWEGQIEQSEEVVLVAKTRAELVPALSEKVLQIHAYECPCIVAWPLSAGYQPFLDWIGRETDTQNG
jgi:periplasmic divalent cation tolerance protein